MIALSHNVRIFLASDPVDFRKGHDGLAALVQSQLRQKPFDGSVYVFRAKRADRLKLIYWDGSGLVMAYICAACSQPLLADTNKRISKNCYPGTTPQPCERRTAYISFENGINERQGKLL